MKRVKISDQFKGKVLEQLREQVGVVDIFFEEVRKTDKLDEQGLSDRFEVFVADNADEITVKDRGTNLPLFTMQNRFIKTNKEVKVLTQVLYGSFDKHRFPKTVSALAGVNWVESHSN